MGKHSISINNTEYPCRLTMGAMLEFRRRTGQEVTEMQGTDIALVIMLIFCCLVSSCRADGVELPFKDEMDMADHMSPEDLSGWQSENFQAQAASCETEKAQSKKKDNHPGTAWAGCRPYRHEPDGFPTADPRRIQRDSRAVEPK